MDAHRSPASAPRPEHRVAAKKVDIASPISPPRRYHGPTMTLLLLALSTATAAPPPASAPTGTTESVANTHFQLGAILLAEGQYGGAITELEEALRLSPDFPAARAALGDAHARLGRKFEEVGDLEGARSEYRAALTANPALAEDPEFKARMTAVMAPAARAVPTYVKDEEEVEDTRPRAGKVGAVGFTLGAQGLLGITGTFRIGQMASPSITLSPLFHTVDVSLHLVPMQKRWSPFGGAGYTYGYGKLDSTLAGFFHFEGGVELLTKNGFSWKAGLMFCNFGPWLSEADLAWLPLPFSTVSWWFGRPPDSERP